MCSNYGHMSTLKCQLLQNNYRVNGKRIMKNVLTEVNNVKTRTEGGNEEE